MPPVAPKLGRGRRPLMPAPLHVELVVTDERWNSVPDLHRIEGLAAAAYAQLAIEAEPREVVVALGSDAEVRELNRTFRGKDRPTNVLSFPAAGMPEGGLIGDVILAYETCAEEADDRGLSMSDHACHLALHGVLHLLGQDHGDALEAEAMEDLETRLLATIGIADPHDGELLNEYSDETDDEPG